MQSRERVLAAIQHEPIDRVPMRYNARAEVTAKLKAHFGFDTDEQLMRRLGIDFRFVAPRYVGPTDAPRSYIPPNAPPPPEASSAATAGGIVNNFHVYSPFENMTDISELDAFEEFMSELPNRFDAAGIRDDVARINADEAYFITYKLGGRIFMSSQERRGLAQFMVDILTMPDFVHRLMEIQTQYTLDMLRKTLDAAGNAIDCIQYNDDQGTQQSLLLSPALFEEFLLPRIRRVWEMAHDYGVRVFMHSCGAIRPIVPHLIDAGLDILNPIQVGAEGMAPEGLKRDFGDRLTFSGGMDVQSTLPFGTPDEVRREATERIRVLGAGGGYILDSTNLIQPDTSVENVLAMFDTGRECAL